MAFQKGNNFSAGRTPWNRAKHVLVKCENCGKELDRLEKNACKRQFCNHTCHAEWKMKQTHVKVSCAYCGTDISRHKKRVEAAELSFCSKECFAKSPHAKFRQGNTINSGRTPWNKGKPHMRGEAHPLYGIGHTPESIEKMRESHTGKHPSEETRSKLRARPSWNRGKRWEEIANSYEKHPRLGKKHTEHARINMSENHADFSLDKHPQWNGGTSFLPYTSEFNEQLKESIRERDGKICQRCFRTEEQVLQEEGLILTVHHIHYNKMNNEDLIALCNSCNLKVNFNRNYWEQYFMENLKQRSLLKKRM